MIEKYYTVEQVSEILDIHPKTIQRYIREGRLSANKVGKSWRIAGQDLNCFIQGKKDSSGSEAEKTNGSFAERAKASAVIDIAVYHKDEAIYIMNALTGEMNSKPPEYGSSSMNTQYITEESKVRITLWGGIRFIEVLLQCISSLEEHLR